MRAEELGKSLENASKEIQAAVQIAVAQTARATFNNGVRLVNQKLKTSKADYLNNFFLDKLSDTSYVIWLQGKIPNMIESGFDSFDIKEGLLRSTKAKTGKDGKKWITVPFRIKPFSTAPLNLRQTLIRENALQNIKNQGLLKSIKVGGNALQGIVAKLKNTGRSETEGMVKIQKTYEKRTSSTYMTFRRVSENSPAYSWLHPGWRPGAQIFPAMEQYLTSEIDNIIQKLL